MLAHGGAIETIGCPATYQLPTTLGKKFYEHTIFSHIHSGPGLN